MTHLKYFGVEIDFPYANPYPSQKLLMANTIRACCNRENALLESPTGTGKSAALLTAALAFQASTQTSPREHSVRSQAPTTPANSTFSIFSAPLDASSNSQDIDRTNDTPQVWYTTRTHGQLKQLISEYRKLPYVTQMAILASRKYLCPNKKVANSDDVNAKCQQEVDANKCPYIMKGGIPREFRPGGKYAKHDIEDLLEYGIQEKRCPYHMSLVILSRAKLIFCPYNHVLDPRVKGILDISLVGAILIIDEGHNLENVCRENGSFRATKEDFIFTMSLVRNMFGAELEVADDHITTTINILSHMMNWFGASARGMRFARTKELVQKDMRQILLQWDMTMQSWPKMEVALAEVIKAKVENKHFLPARALSFLERIFVMLALCFKDNMQHCTDYNVAITIGENENNDNLICSLLNPGLIFQCAARETNSIIISSGTLSPLETFSTELQTKFQTAVSAPHIIGSDQVASFVLTNALDGTVFSSAFNHLQVHEMDVILGLGHVFELLLPVIPDGVLFFVPSYPFLNRMLSTWRKSGIMQHLRDIKPVFFEEPNSKEPIYNKYKASIDKQQGGFLCGVFRGRMSEGIDFLDEQARAVFVFGVPYPPYADVEVTMKRQYNDERLDGGNTWYEAQALRALFQAVGRCIRHERDFGSVILIDSRFPAFTSRFPAWLRNSFRSHIGVSDIRAQLSSFYSEMRAKFPRVVRWRLGSPLNYLCKECEEIVVQIPAVDMSESVSFNRQGFVELTRAGFDTACVFISAATRHSLSAATLTRNDWRPEDKICYGVVVCQCGAVLGAHVRAGQACDRKLLGGTLLLLSRLVPMPEVNEKRSKRERKPRKPRKPRNREKLDKGQQKLCF